MKKLLSLLLAVAMVFSLAMMMTACGDVEDPADTDTSSVGSSDAGSSDAGTGDANPFPAALANVAALDISAMNLDLSAWEFGGGMIKDVEMDADAANSFLDGCGGSFWISFPGENKIEINAGDAKVTGTYELVAENYFMHITTASTTYYAVFSMVESDLVMLLVDNEIPDTVVYLRVIEG